MMFLDIVNDRYGLNEFADFLSDKEIVGLS